MVAYSADFVLWVAIALSLVQMIGFNGEVRFSKAAATTLFLALTYCFGVLIYSFVISDFSLKIVFENSHTAKPLIYKISGTWGNHEGSLLLFTWLLTAYGFLYSLHKFNPRALAVQGLICFLFLLFLKLTSNPFEVLPVTMPNGMGLNPLLQDIGLATHPPILYTGYVGFSLVFSITIGYLLDGNIDREFARKARFWGVFAWSFLTLGIGLGSWWAYRELGWGGFWFWDPVENSSLMPWLAGTALIHSLIITEKRRTLKRWTVLLAIMTFGLALTGFFLVRSGVLTSVHSFANDPARGYMILLMLGILVGFGLVVYAFKGHKLKTFGQYDFLSRETMILFNNLLLIVLCACIFIGTIYPLILNSLGGETISVGAPFYYATFVPGAIIVLYLCATATLAKWKHNELKKLLKRLAAPLSLPKVLSVVAFFLFLDRSEYHTIIFFAALYLLFAVMWEFQHKRKLENLPMIFAHGGLAILVMGILLSTSFDKKKEIDMKPGDKARVAHYNVVLKDVSEGFHDNFAYRRGEFEVTKNHKVRTVLEPEMRVYPVEKSTTTESAIYRDVFSDLYIIIGEKNSSGAYAVRMYSKPFVNLIWIGVAIMFGAGVLRSVLQTIITRRLKQNALIAG